MREILFRGKQRLAGGWCEGFPVKTGDHFRISTRNDMISFGVDLETVGQYTGLYDGTKLEDLTDAEKLDFYHQHYIGEDGMSVRFQCIDDVKPLWRGKRIFEGDIVNGLFLFEKPVAGVVTFRDGSFGVKWMRGCVEEFNAFTSCCNVEWEVIGNGVDNPELLEGGANDG